MNKLAQQSIIAGIVATVVFTIVAYMGPMMGLPPMSPPGMLSMMMGMPIALGWIGHFMIGVIFAFAYAYLFVSKVKISNAALKGAVFGFVIFIFAEIMIALMGAMLGGMPEPEGGMGLMMLGAFIGHVVFGIVVALMVKAPPAEQAAAA